MIAWMPKGMDAAEKQAFADAHPDPHMAAAMAWESWAAQLDADPQVLSVSTGAQSVTYARGGNAAAAAIERALWHRSRARAYSVNVGEHYRRGWTHDPERNEVTYPSESIPPTGPMQVNLLNGTVGPKELK